MRATLLEPSHHQTIIERTHEFTFDHTPGAGFSFDVDAEGQPTNDNSHARRNYELAVTNSNPWGNLIDHGIITRERTVYHAALYGCACGETFEGGHDHLCGCGRAYNGSGYPIEPHSLTCSAYAAGFDCMCFEADGEYRVRGE